MPISAQRIRILIADDHRLHREGLLRLLEGEADFLVVGQAATRTDALRLAQQLKPDVLLLGRSMIGAYGKEILRELAALETEVRTILMTDRGHETDVVSAVEIGARGVISKDADGEMLFRSIRKIMDGEYWISRSSVGDLVSAVRRLLAHATEATPRKPNVTPRQQEIIASVAAGRSNKQIAQQFSLSEDTVKRHLTNIFTRLGLSNRLELALFASQHDLGDPHPHAFEAAQHA
jgi:DNA-binding NarL/FixJ family response regulator